jgi:hypothetical protein
VRELPDAHFLEVGALGVKEVVVYLCEKDKYCTWAVESNWKTDALARNTGDCVLANGGHVGAGFGWPVVLRRRGRVSKELNRWWEERLARTLPLRPFCPMARRVSDLNHSMRGQAAPPTVALAKKEKKKKKISPPN